MAAMKKFALIILITVTLACLGYGIWSLAINNNKPEQSKDPTNTPLNTGQSTSSGSNSTVALADNTVRFDIPSKWEVSKPGCIKESPAYENYTYLDSVSLTPSEKLPTVYGGGTEFFTINVCVFKDSGDESLAAWLEGAAGDPSSNDITSNGSINNYESYYRKKVESYEEIYYVLRKNQTTVLVTARTYEPGTLSDGTKVGNFRQYETAIKQLTETVQIN
jgi:hypothetical protein